MKYLVLIGDGMSDEPVRSLGGKTPLQVAKTPNMDFLVQNGTCGWVNNVPKGLEPGSDVAAMSILGYDPKKYYSGRGPLEAASLGVKLKKDEIAFRCNLVTVKDGRMKDFTAGHISTKEASKIMRELDKKLGSKQIKFYPGLSYRHLLVVSSAIASSTMKTTPPHDITGKKIHDYLPKGKGSELLLQLMNESEVLLHEIKTKATIIWPWSPGGSPDMPAFKKKFGKTGAIITAVHLLKGIGKILGLEVINVPGATGYLDTNYKGKAEYALRALKKHDIVFVHVEAPDEAGHEGDVKNKIKAIEDFDKLVVGTILEGIRKLKTETRILVLPDHPTPIKHMTHTMEAVPFVVYESRTTNNESRVKGYNEKEIRKSKLQIASGYSLLDRLLFAR
ncbi:cofactor-independent phosphoglycerate mutase [candidate division WOR-1 bacterium RIFOXYB2_FULL_42_35]|uniref:Cofactor-independent phosphoglycerate mutase n=1 Tax=candidate division WOR-1 bacterium RIFOXYC2_FULL_41_25 TaxID=1802586 RepID=A0A1F4TK51_UNCSA|nr:MAG: cofactor-independent phosphoglycerate mutase [candidate division WOR-1 bacterium RIFOXYA2_FULL_41_14]OGC22430.1 MAG: cofactor-independent phosphoglycerate mutase [candidate division WOR-1 bacterium RIFOXYB2_FULL_42_35]OGC33108.1 MAG: cofactor-independent phosphoglycerate mutase [candidate division WOR-1 bacterium RIFOXYC2_FULL_41_25]OGC43428.1 MAG: cofactor-independent phosphoglycerate mutase [candidate division WOR-1 bacterium RIFOXYD2_FULL_41_8]